MYAAEINTDLTIQVLKHATEPFFYGNKLILSYTDERLVRSVGAIFGHEGYNTLHVYEINKFNVFCLVYPVPQGVEELTYRIIVDGLVMADPNNPRGETNMLGVAFSSVRVPENLVRKRIVNPEFGEGGKVTFTYTALPGKTVTLSGDFNGWDPYVDVLLETSPGTYTVTRRIAPGEHYYFFFVNGDKRLDPYNKTRMVSTIGEEVNAFITGG